MTRLPRHRVYVAATVLVLSAGLAGCGDDEPTAQDPAGEETSSAAAPTDEPTDDPTAETSEPGTPTEMVTVPVYFVGDTPSGPALYREFRQVEADNPMEEAMALVTSGDALDPDYGTLYPGGTFESVAFSESAGAIVAQVKDDGWNTPADGMTERQAKLAVQQLVYTVQGIQQERVPVLVQNVGNEPAPLFGIDTSGGLKAAKQLDVLALMNVTTPEEGTAVSGSFTADGVGSSFEANVLWEVRDGSGNAVVEGFTTAEGWMDKLYPWTAEVDVSALAPGTYTFVARTDDPSDGEGAGPTEDTKTIVVS